MPDFTVRQYGTDSSGRPVFMTTYMHEWWESVVAELGFRPTIVQGAFMTRAGGGAAASAGYHDQGGCLDVRTWDLSPTQLDALIRVTRARGGASWRRDESAVHGGMDSHCHITLGSDSPLSPGAQESWRSYLAGDNGLANNAPDYEWRPNPIVTTPPKDDDMAFKDWPQEDQDALVNAVAAAVTKRLLDTDLTPKQDEPKSTVRAALNRLSRIDEAMNNVGRDVGRAVSEGMRRGKP